MAAQARIGQARAAFQPRVHAAAGYQRLSAIEPFVLRVPRPGGESAIVIAPNIPNRYQLEASVEQPLFQGGRLRAQLEAARQEAAVAQAAERAEQEALAYRIATAYWRYVEAQALATAAEENVRRLEAHAQDARNRRAQGLLLDSDVFDAEVALAQAQFDALQRRQAAERAAVTLNALVGLPPDATPVPTDRPDTAARAVPSLDTLRAWALRRRPDLAGLRYAIARAAALLDRALTWVGLNGRAVIPLLLGFGCVTMATITTRILGSERERTIATFLLAFTIPCSAQLGVIAGLLFPLGGRFVFLYLLTVTSVFLLAGTTADAVMSGRPTDLLLDLPALRMPHLDNVLKKTWNKSFVFVREALPLFLLGSLIIGVLRVTGALEVLQNLLAPVTVWWLGLPREAATAFVMGMIRRDFGAAGLYHLRLGAPQTLVASVTITLFVPCVASLLVIMKERGKLEGACVWAATMVGAFVLGGILARALGT